MRRIPLGLISVLTLVSLTACGLDMGSRAGKTPSATPTPTPVYQTVPKFLAGLNAAVKKAGVFEAVALDDDKKPMPKEYVSWANYGTSPVSLHVLFDSASDRTEFYQLPGRDLIVSSEGEWVSIGPKTLKSSKEISTLPKLVELTHPLAFTGLVPELKSTKGFLKIDEAEKKVYEDGASLPVPTTLWRAAVIPPKPGPEYEADQPGLSPTTAFIYVWVDATGFPRRIEMEYANLEFLGLVLKKVPAGTQLVPPPASKIQESP